MSQLLERNEPRVGIIEPRVERRRDDGTECGACRTRNPCTRRTVSRTLTCLSCMKPPKEEREWREVVPRPARAPFTSAKLEQSSRTPCLSPSTRCLWSNSGCGSRNSHCPSPNLSCSSLNSPCSSRAHAAWGLTQRAGCSSNHTGHQRHTVRRVVHIAGRITRRAGRSRFAARCLARIACLRTRSSGLPTNCARCLSHRCGHRTKGAGQRVCADRRLVSDASQ